MLGAGAQCTVRTICGIGSNFIDQTYSTLSLPYSSPSVSSSFRFNIKLDFSRKLCRFRSNPILIFCKSSSRGSNFGGRSNNSDDRDLDDYLEASLLLPETLSHYRMRRRGFQEDIKWKSSSSKNFSFSNNSINQGFLQRFQSPTVFLKISCDGDFLLPIVVGDFAIEKLIDSQWGDEYGDSPDQYLFVKNLVQKLGYRSCLVDLTPKDIKKVNMVRVTERVINTYFAKLFLSKPGDIDLLSVDARPSDAINVANRCKAPIYVNKQIIATDAIRINYGMGRLRDSKSVYDVSLDSAADGSDFLAEELNLVRNMNLAIKEERYKDAAMWKNKLLKLLKSILDK